MNNKALIKLIDLLARSARKKMREHSNVKHGKKECNSRVPVYFLPLLTTDCYEELRHAQETKVALHNSTMRGTEAPIKGYNSFNK
jgi:hypothetical protein